MHTVDTFETCPVDSHALRANKLREHGNINVSWYPFQFIPNIELKI